MKSPATSASRPSLVTQRDWPRSVPPASPGLVVPRTERPARTAVDGLGLPYTLKFMKPGSSQRRSTTSPSCNKWPWKEFGAKPQARCLIPVTHFAEAEGPKSSMTRTWLNIKDQPIIAWGGLWRDQCRVGAGPVRRDDRCQRSDDACCTTACRCSCSPPNGTRGLRGSFDDLLAFQARKFPDELIEMERTPELWVKKKKASA